MAFAVEAFAIEVAAIEVAAIEEAAIEEAAIEAVVGSFLQLDQNLVGGHYPEHEE